VIYHQLGTIPRKRHTVFRQQNGQLYAEELMGNKGFDGLSSLIYHVHQPTGVRRVRLVRELTWDGDKEQTFHHRHFRTGQLPQTCSPTLDRIPLLFNNDVAISFVRPQAGDDVFYRNAQGDEIVFVSEGAGVLESLFGDLPFGRGDYLVIPRGIVHRYRFSPAQAGRALRLAAEDRAARSGQASEGTGAGAEALPAPPAQPDIRLLVIESAGDVRTPRRYRNEHGQLLEQSPYSERDIRRPAVLQTHDETGDFPVLVKKDNRVVEFVLAHHPFDAIGWDGYYYPWALNIADFEPRVGRFHLPPPTHQTFEGDGFVVCSFCPRPYDFDPQAVPVPYNHSNVMSDEVIYYASSEFMSRRGIEYGSITLHPDGIAHGPHPGLTEQSLGQKRTDELAVMLDSFRPLRPSAQAVAVEDPGYQTSWIEQR
jgi:homogentisate 1,2-dioxygenase